MKQPFNQSYFFLSSLGVLASLTGVQPALANQVTDSHSIFAQYLTAQEHLPTLQIQITDIELRETATGLEIIFQTSTGESLVPATFREGNRLVLNLADVILTLPTGDEFRAVSPFPGIAEISAVQVDQDDVQVTITGETDAPSAEVIASPEALVLSVTPDATAQADEEIELVVVAESEVDYFVPNASTATRTNVSILNTPQSVQVVPQEVLEDQQIVRLDEALRNVSGVTFGGTDLGRGLLFNIRGFDEAPILRNGFRQFGADVINETANLERVEVLKGPASVLYGEIAPGGLINLITEKPTRVPFYEIETQVGNRNYISPSIDFSGPLTEDGSMLYRLNALYRTSDDFQNVDPQIERVYVSPVVTWNIDENTDVTFELEYFDEQRPPTFGIPALGEEIADIPFDRITNEPDDLGNEEFLSVGYDFEHRFSESWTLRNAFRYTQQNALLEVAFPFEIDEETGIITRFWAAQPQDAESYSLQTSAVGELTTGAIDHEVLFGVDLNATEDNYNELIRFGFDDPLPLDIFDPEYGIFPRPDFDELPLLSDIVTETKRLGVFLQDRVAFGDRVFLLAGLRYDTVEQIVTNNPNAFEPETTETTQNSDALVPRVGVVYKPTETISLYASYSQSFTPNSEIDSAGDILEPERGKGFEVGVKSELLEDNLFATLAYFRITKRNVATEDPDDPFSFVAVGEQNSQGIELDVTGEILPGFNIIASYAYIDAEITEDNVFAIGNRLFNAPEHSASLWTTYKVQQGDYQGLGFGLGLYFVGERQGDLGNTFELDSYFLTNAAVFYEHDNWRAALNFKNIFDVDYIAGASPVRIRGNDPGEPFTVVGSVSVKF